MDEGVLWNGERSGGVGYSGERGVGWNRKRGVV